MRRSIEDNIVLTILKQITESRLLIKAHRKREIALQWIKKLNIKPSSPEMPVKNLSGGNQQRVVIAKWLASNPKILIIDEPTNGIDIGAKNEIHKLLRELASNGMGIIMVSSELPEVLAISDRIFVMRRGKIVAQFKGGEATQEEIMSNAILNQPTFDK